MEKNINYESPQVWEIGLEEDGILCASQFGTEGVGDRSGSYDEWELN